MKEQYLKKLFAASAQLDDLRDESHKLLLAGEISPEKQAELQDILNDVAIGVSDLAVRLRDGI